MLHVRFKLNEGAKLERKTEGAVGFDLCVTEKVQICKGMVGMYGTGVYWQPDRVELMKQPCASYYEKSTQVTGLVIARSSIWKLGVQIPNSLGVIDMDYRGEIMLPLIVGSWVQEDEVVIDEGTRIAQLVIIASPTIVPVIVDDLDSTERGTGGFGSTGDM